MDSDEYVMMVNGWEIGQQIEWDRVRTICFYSGADKFKTAPTLQQIKHLPYFDGEAKPTNWDRFKAILERQKERKKGGG